MNDKKRRIFIVTWYKSENYGTCLQAYATYAVTSKNADVIFLDRRTYYSFTKISFVFSKVLRKIKAKLRHSNSKVIYADFEKNHKRKVNKIECFVTENYKVISIRNYQDIQKIDKWTDCYLVGSDQMWNPWMLNPAYLLDFVPKNSKKPKYSYAASFGVDNIPDEKKKLYKKYLPQFSKITVREPRASELVKELSGKDATVVLDPTFLLTQEEWRKFSEQSNCCEQYGLDHDYIICYFIGSPEFNHLETVRKIADSLNLKVVLLPTKEKDYKEKDITIIADACAYDFVSLINNAKLVCTDSFHAVVFSFLMNTAFYDFPRFKKGDKYSQESRLHNIIDKFNLNDSYWKDDLSVSDMEKHMKCNYSSGYTILDDERKKSLNILYEMLESQ